MSKIRVELEINPSNLNEVQAFSALMLAMGGNDTATIQVPTNLGKAGGFKAPTIETAKAVVEAPAPAEKVEEAEASAPAATTEKSAETESDVSLDDLKLELGVKVDANRDAIVSKLKEFGATKLSNLPEENYSEMLTFLKALK